ncbi:MAG: hypothetical protein DMF68_01495 [Acidobacteria bacterium]|nr:MAG: hypothetical protein DMF68_01495 [Acidobacteriota bacterium]
MKFNPKRARINGGSRPFSLMRAQRDVKVTIVGADETPTVNVLDIRNNRRMMATESEIYGATFNSFSTLDRRASRSDVLRQLLDEGTVLANLKGVFWRARRKSVMRKAA